MKEAVAGPRAEAARGLVVGLDLRSLENALGSQELRVEAALLFRVIYKNRNQHRRTGYLRNLERCARHLTRLSRLQLPAVLADLRDAAGAQGACPSSDACALALRRLLAGAHTCTAAIQDAESAALDVSGHLSMGFFLPLGVVVLSICARLRALLSARTAAIADAYNALARVLESLPPSSTRTHARHEPRAVPTPWLACTGADARPPRVAPLPRTFLVAWPSGVPRAVACGTVGATRIPEVDDSAGRGAKEAAASSAGEEPPDAETARGMDAELGTLKRATRVVWCKRRPLRCSPWAMRALPCTGS